jgi:L-lactate utilization protein LutC
MATIRDEILGRLRAAQRDEAPPAPWQSRRHYDDLAARFTESLIAVKGEVIRADGLDDAWNKLSDLLRDLGARRVVANDEPPLNTLDLPARWPDLDWHVVGKTPGDLRAFAASADVGLSGGAAALAETGSVVVTSGPGRSRLATLLPPVHVALVPTSCLTPDIFTWTAARQGNPPASMTVISGPSKTADIEQTLAIGVHGPGRFIVILYEG